MKEKFNEAPILKRLVASLIDIALYILLFFVIAYAVVKLSPNVDLPADQLVYTPEIIIGTLVWGGLIIVANIMSTYYFGCTLGKKFLGLKVVSIKGNALNLSQCLNRNTLWVAYFAISFLGIFIKNFSMARLIQTSANLVMILDFAFIIFNKGAAIHDLIAGTRVVSSRRLSSREK